MDYSRPDLADRLAAEYVTGTLRGPARRRLEQLLPAHPTLRAAVKRWEAGLMPLTASVSPQAPSAEVWKRIVARIGGAAAAEAPVPSWSSSLSFWRSLSMFAGVVSLSLLVLFANPKPNQPPIVVVLSSTTAPDGAAAPATFVASISGDGRAIVTQPLMGVSVQPDRVLELWAVPGKGAPRSLGLISASGASVVSKSRLPAGTAALAVSLEPPGGSTTGAPTGPVLYVGKLLL
ncbi:MAG: anti-sigma factor domain-containing protein [Rhizobacter sp.]